MLRWQDTFFLFLSTQSHLYIYQITVDSDNHFHLCINSRLTKVKAAWLTNSITVLRSILLIFSHFHDQFESFHTDMAFGNGFICLQQFVQKLHRNSLALNEKQRTCRGSSPLSKQRFVFFIVTFWRTVCNYLRTVNRLPFHLFRTILPKFNLNW